VQVCGWGGCAGSSTQSVSIPTVLEQRQDVSRDVGWGVQICLCAAARPPGAPWNPEHLLNTGCRGGGAACGMDVVTLQSWPFSHFIPQRHCHQGPTW
jgi:hypothetical protein